MKQFKVPLIHIMAWIAYYFINEIEWIVDGPSKVDFIVVAFSYFILMIIFYIIYFWLNLKFLSKGKYLSYFFSIVILFFIYNLFRLIEVELVHHEFPLLPGIGTINGRPISYFSIMLRTFTYYIFHIPLFTCFFIFKNSLDLQKNLNQKDKTIADQKLMVSELETTNLQSELSFLQSQINPHFLFNTLNMLYAKAVQCNVELSEGIYILSNIMRYALVQHNPDLESSKAIDLENEILHIENIIKIHRLRFPNSLYLEFEKETAISGYKFIPFVLITLVENIFKHGEVNDPDSVANIVLSLKNNVLKFSTYNKKKNSIKEVGTGIGIVNVKSRLKHFYKDRYSLKIEESDGFFSVLLIVDLK